MLQFQLIDPAAADRVCRTIGLICQKYNPFPHGDNGMGFHPFDGFRMPDRTGIRVLAPMGADQITPSSGCGSRMVQPDAVSAMAAGKSAGKPGIPAGMVIPYLPVVGKLPLDSGKNSGGNDRWKGCYI